MKTKFISKYGKPITGQRNFKRPATIGGGTTADDGSTQQAEEQVAASPLPFQNPRAAANLPAPVHAGFGRRQVQGSTGGSTRPRGNTAAAPRSEPMAHSTRMRAVGYSGDYAADYNPSTHPTARTRVMRGPVKGAKSLVSPMSDDDFSAGMKSYQKQHGRL